MKLGMDAAMKTVRCACGATIEATAHDVKLGRSFFTRCREAEEARRAGRRFDGRFECEQMQRAIRATFGSPRTLSGAKRAS
jgi:hypothetical protein